MKNGDFLIHLALAAAISFGVSLFAWVALGVFEIIPFWAVSTGVAIIAAATGWLSGRRVAVTLAVALILRVAILAAAIGV